MVIILQSVTFWLYAYVQPELKQGQKMNILNTN